MEFVLEATQRGDQGKGASRRLRHQGLVPAIVYGGDAKPESISLKHNQLLRNLEEEAFYSQLIELDFGERKDKVILRDLQRHPAKLQILHADLQRVKADQDVRVSVPLHIVNAATSPGIKLQGGIVNRILVEVEISCLPKDIPQAIEVDLSSMNKGETIHLSDIKLPEGVQSTELLRGDEYNLAVVAIY